MRNKTVSYKSDAGANHVKVLSDLENDLYPGIGSIKTRHDLKNKSTIDPSEILFITSYPPRVCGIATYSHDLIKALNNKFSNSLSI